MFMKSLPSTMVFGQPELLGIKKTDNGQEFVVKADLNSLDNKMLSVGSGVEAGAISEESASGASVVAPAEQNASNRGR